MAAALGDKALVPAKACTSTGKEAVVLGCEVVYGSSGAIGTTSTYDPGVSAADGGTGTTNITFPACARARVHADLIEGTTGDKYAVIDTVTATSGAAVIKIWDISGAAVTDPASGDILQVTIIGYL